MRSKRLFVLSALGLAAVSLSLTFPRLTAQRGGTTPVELVRCYDSLATTILSVKETESNLVQAILASTYSHANGICRRAKEDIVAGRDVTQSMETLADLVAQLGGEGDASVAAIRKRLLEGGHHHNAAGEEQGIYEEGFVIVTRAAKKEFLTAARNIAQLGGKPTAAALDAQWQTVAKQYNALVSER